MKLTNVTGLDERWVEVAEQLFNNHPKFENNKFSVTELLKSEKQVVLQRRHDDEIEIDIQRAFALLEGTAFHEIVERVTTESEKLKNKWLVEQRLEKEIAPGIFISGGFDALNRETWTLHDQKNTKLAAIEKAKDGTDDKWFRQLVLYSILIEMESGDKPTEGYITAMAKDHSYIKAKNDADYPKYPVQVIKFDLSNPVESKIIWEEAKDKAIRIKDILDNNLEPAPCTYADMWCDENWAIMKPNAKRALKKFDNPMMALEEYMKMDKKEEYRIYHRVSDPNNCACYCPCAQFCEQGKKALEMESICEDVTDEILPF